MVQPNKLLLVLLALLPSVAHAATDEAAEQADTRAYVETSYLIAPRRIEDFVLEHARYDERQKFAGAGFRYLADGHQETRIYIYVYPAGRMDRALAMATGMEAFRGDLERAAEAGTYTQLRLQEEEAFALVDEPPASSVDTPETARERDLGEILAIVAAGNRPSGRKLPITLNLQPQDWPMYSVGYLFYWQLYFFKVRATAAQERISAEQFHALADRAARALVPAIEVANVGACAQSVINVAADASSEDIANTLITQATEHQGYNCHERIEAAGISQKSEHAEVIEISYQPGEWRSQ